jgi:glycosyltransferase involved in cell wall biosynthesis
VSAATTAILHVDSAATYGGSLRCLENFLKTRRDATLRHIVCVSPNVIAGTRLRECCSRLVPLPALNGHSSGPATPSRARTTRRVLRTALSVYRLIVRENVKLLRLNNSPTVHLGSLIAARLRRVPCVAWLRSFPASTRDAAAWLIGANIALVAVSESVRDAFIRRGVRADRITTLYDGTDVAPEQAPRADRPQPRFTAGMLTRLVAWKGCADFVQAAALVLRDAPEARFVIAGPDDPTEPHVRSQLAGEIRRLGVEHAVTLAAAVDDPLQFLLSLDCLVNPSYPAEPFGMSLLEAMALGRPVVATEGGGPSEIIEHGRSGLLVPARDPAALAGAMAQLLRDERLRVALGTCARQRVVTTFELQSRTATQEAFLRHLIGANHRGVEG